ncbi:Gfo/Idh/MocA family oxidoreductase [Mobilitalea sibirica]|uniref:Gfo/Idh/MocA family oxidoreductase n=1 Tax=Mobilitalea sibirica TaxID=1462919 RepID=A0A8J7HDA6_9FIRM|nr:Gfo/Idh/MocA family oxidoreductase [Mobilitalea sibirica]MBH1940519.1 Gfo/Idh/MocA family oxidoreductase [Mobilitalea sibirica]
MQVSDGMNYAPKGKPAPVVKEGEFIFAAIALDHGHIYGMCNGLIEAGATLKWVYDPDPEKIKRFCNTFPGVKVASSEEEILQDREVKLVAGAAVTSKRCELGMRVMDAGKDYFTDKAPLTTLEQLDMAKEKVKKTGKKYMVYYSERLHVESAIYAGYLIQEGAIGKVIQVLGLGPHRLNAPSRPDWFFQKDYYGGILCDIGSHQIEQFLFYANVKDAQVVRSQIGNYNNSMYPELDDFGDCNIVGDNGATNYFRVDWFTPDGLSTWGDGRTIILGTEGYIELRKYVNVGMSKDSDHVFLVNKQGEKHYEVKGKVGYPFFGQLILDCINRTENAMTQDHAFKAAELSVKAQLQAVELTGRDIS